MVVGMSGGYGAWPPPEPEPTLELRQPSRWEKLRGRLPLSRTSDQGTVLQPDDRFYGGQGGAPGQYGGQYGEQGQYGAGQYGQGQVPGQYGPGEYGPGEVPPGPPGGPDGPGGP